MNTKPVSLKRTARSVAALGFSLLMGIASSWGQAASSPKAHPDFDKRMEKLPAKASLNATRQASAARLKTARPGVEVAVDPVTGGPAWIHGVNGFLSRSTADEIARLGDLGLRADDPHRAIKAF